MTCEGCESAVKRLLGSEKYIQSFETNVPDMSLKVIGGDNIDQ